MKKVQIELSTWKRKNHFNLYKDYDDPCFNICSYINVTNAVNSAKNKNQSIFLTLLHCSAMAMNNVDAFRLRMEEEQVWKMNKIHPSATVLREDDTFNFCNFELVDDLDLFIGIAQKARNKAVKDEPLIDFDNKAEQVFYSVIPWIDFTSFKHAASKSCRDVPKIVFGKITGGQDALKMPVSVELHHALADGMDIGKYLALFQKLIDQISV
jgi:chloramphenicol O-acetyltransferase type A